MAGARRSTSRANANAARRTSPKLQAIHAAVRALSPHFAADRYWADEMSALQSAVLAGGIGEGLLPLLA